MTTEEGWPVELERRLERRRSGRSFLTSWQRRALPEDEFEALLAPHVNEMYQLAYRLAGNQYDAEDLVQSVLIKLYPKSEQLLDKQELRSWLRRVVHNEFVDGWRRKQHAPMNESDFQTASGEGLLDQQPSEDQPDSDVEKIQLQQKLQIALNKLSDDHRKLIMLFDVQGYSLPEIESMTGLARGTIKSRLHRARASLKEKL